MLQPPQLLLPILVVVGGPTMQLPSSSACTPEMTAAALAGPQESDPFRVSLEQFGAGPLKLMFLKAWRPQSFWGSLLEIRLADPLPLQDDGLQTS